MLKRISSGSDSLKWETCVATHNETVVTYAMLFNDYTEK